jgi:hypothetical protein
LPSQALCKKVTGTLIRGAVGVSRAGAEASCERRGEAPGTLHRNVRGCLHASRVCSSTAP